MSRIFFAFFLAVLSTVIAAFGALLLKLGTNVAYDLKKLRLSVGLPRQALGLAIKNYKLVLGVFLYVLSTAPFLLSLKYADLSLIYPVVSLSYVWVMLLSYWFLGERINSYKLMSIIFIIIGVAFMGASAG